MEIATVLVGTCILEHVFRVRADLCPVNLNIFLCLKIRISDYRLRSRFYNRTLRASAEQRHTRNHHYQKFFHRVLLSLHSLIHSRNQSEPHGYYIISPFVFVVILEKFKKSSYFPKSPVNNPSGPFYSHLAHPGCQSRSSTVSSVSSSCTPCCVLASSASFCASFSFSGFFSVEPVLAFPLSASRDAAASASAVPDAQ